MKLTMVGTGYVGLVTGSCFAKTGNDVICLDLDQDKIARLNRGECPIFEPSLAELIQRNVATGRMRFTSNKDEAYSEAEVIFICVGTPAGADGSTDLSAMRQAAIDIAEFIDRAKPPQDPKLIVVKSTVPVGTTEQLRDEIKARTKAAFYIANNPEFLKEGAAVSDFQKPDRVICGTEAEEAAEILRDLYEPFVRQGNPIIVMDMRSAEMVKYASNAMLACKISFINEIANLCERTGADIRSVREGMCADRRIGNQFLHPGLGFGGSCFPKDILAVINMGKAAGHECAITSAVYAVNKDQRRIFWDKIIGHFGSDLTGRTLAFWGAAFKPETDDIREAPALVLMQWALDAGAVVRAFDPVAMKKLAAAMPAVGTYGDMYEVLSGCDALVISTEWSDFRNPDFARIVSALKSKVIFDGRNIYRRELMQRHGFVYYSVGREPVTQAGQHPDGSESTAVDTGLPAAGIASVDRSES